MTEKDEVAKSLLTWCQEKQWDLLLRLAIPADSRVGNAEEDFRHWLYLVEHDHALPSFRWARFMTRKTPLEIYVLLAGVQSGAIPQVMRQWPGVIGDLEADVGLEYRRGGSTESVEEALKRLLANKAFTIEVGVGPKTIRHRVVAEEDADEKPAEPGPKETRIKLTAKARRARRRERRYGSIFDFWA